MQRPAFLPPLLAALLVVFPAAVAAGEWPMWGRTPQRNMVSPNDAPLTVDFDPGQLAADRQTIDPATTRNVRWIARLGSQTYGNPTVAEGRVFVGTNNQHRDDPRFVGDYSLLKALDAATGQPHWTLTVPKLPRGPVMDFAGVGICSSPAVDGQRVYVVTTRCEVLCLDVEGLHNGNQGPFLGEAQYLAGLGRQPPRPPVELRPSDADIVWRLDMAGQLGVRPWNVTSSSVAVAGDLLIVATSNGADPEEGTVPNPDAPALVVLDKHTGRLVAQERSGVGRSLLDGAWSSPAYGDVEGRGVIYYGCGGGYLWAFDLPERAPPPATELESTLTLRWRVDVNPPHRRHDAEGHTIEYLRGRAGPRTLVGTPVVHEGRVFVALGQDPELGPGDGQLIAVDADSGRILWTNDQVDLTLSTPSIHDGLLYLADYSGFVHCLEAASGEPVWVHDTFSPIWGSTLVADGKLFVGTDGGDLVVLAAGRQLDVLATVYFREPIQSTPVAAGGVLYVATSSHLYAIAEPRE